MRKLIKDEVWIVRSALTPPNFAILNYLSSRPFASATEIYKELTKQFTRKTILISLSTLSHLKIIEPHPIPSTSGYRIGYQISELGRELVKVAKDFNKKLGKKAIEKG
ncbi:MAG: hypothetical protein ACP5HJ_00420 [Candidatus Micrarchaeia archaeon]|jgi:DNA-binding HxlR family transcriptional regulator